MSDSYSKWCEEREEKEITCSRSNINAVINTKKFITVYTKASFFAKNAKIQISKTCGNCKYLFYTHIPGCYSIGENYDFPCCSKCGFMNISVNEHVCKYWKTCYGRKYVRKFECDKDVVALDLIKKKAII